MQLPSTQPGSARSVSVAGRQRDARTVRKGIVPLRRLAAKAFLAVTHARNRCARRTRRVRHEHARAQLGRDDDRRRCGCDVSGFRSARRRSHHPGSHVSAAEAACRARADSRSRRSHRRRAACAAARRRSGVRHTADAGARRTQTAGARHRFDPSSPRRRQEPAGPSGFRVRLHLGRAIFCRTFLWRYRPDLQGHRTVSQGTPRADDLFADSTNIDRRVFTGSER